MNTSVSKNYWSLNIALFLQGFMLYYPIEKLFLRANEFTFTQISIVVITAAVGIMLFEFPSGLLADRWSRKGTMILASVLLAAGSLLMGVSTTITSYAIGTFLWGIYFAMQSGTYGSFLYDMLINAKSEKRFEKMFATTDAIQASGIMVASVFGGIVSEFYGFRLPYYLSVVVAFISIIFLIRLQEPKFHKSTLSNAGHAKDSFVKAFKTPDLRIISATTVVIAIIAGVVFEHNQHAYIAAGISEVNFGWLNATLLSSYIFGGYIAVKLRKHYSVALYTAVLLLGILLAASVKINNLILIILLPTLLAIIMNTFRVYNTTELNRRIGSDSRSAIISLTSTFGRILFIPLAFLIGKIIDSSGYFSIWFIYFSLFSLLTILLIPLISEGKPHETKD